MKILVRGLAVLVLAMFLGECAEFLINMILARELGESGIGQYMTILPSIFLIMLLASFELPASVSKLVAEKEKRYHRSLIKHAFRMTIIFTACLFAVAAAVIPFVPLFQNFHPMLKYVVLLLIPLVSFSSIARGYFMGKEHMGKIAVSHLLRRIVQMLLLASIYQVLEFDRPTALLIAFCTLAASEVAVFLYLIYSFIVSYQEIKRMPGENMSPVVVRRSLAAVSIPTTALRIFHALAHAAQPFLIKWALVQAGVPAEMATEQFGMVAGVAMTIGTFPAFIAHSFMIMLIPAVAKLHAGAESSKLFQLLQQVMLLTLIYGLPSVTVFYFLAEPLTNLFFHSNHSAYYLQLLWPYFLLHYFIIPMQAFLIGLGLIKDAFFHTFWSTVVSFVVIYLLGARLEWEMPGVIIGMNAGTVLLAMLHYMTICKKIGVPWTLRLSEKRSSL
ncbi:polysaccharide biosynthesis protein [Mesobacillus zeae]|uniref:Polysaccharide biosynthesis protein n=1 Tax=Mesobacillus zeae TaxID=1917180 RepID=A0A398B8J3_9BACI|nr:polysaccharide biosynthesis protein [Mesobacillus zeae]RID85148.1 polysaccharide biosynthesis protein [Mesobacillus zeae]